MSRKSDDNYRGLVIVLGSATLMALALLWLLFPQGKFRWRLRENTEPIQRVALSTYLPPVSGNPSQTSSPPAADTPPAAPETHRLDPPSAKSSRHAPQAEPTRPIANNKTNEAHPAPAGSAEPPSAPAETRPPAEPVPAETNYSLVVFYGGRLVHPGSTVRFDDPALKSLGFSVRYKGPQPPAHRVLRVEWYFNNVAVDPHNFAEGDHAYTAATRYANKVWEPGAFEVKLVVDSVEWDSVPFTVARTAP